MTDLQLAKIGFTAFMSSESTQPSYEELLCEVKQLRSELAAVEQKLQRLLKRDSTTSSQPLSKDAPRKKTKKKRRKSAKKPGGQPGHKGKTRENLPAEKVSRRIACDLAPRCASCGDDGVNEVGERVQQVVDLDEVVELVLGTGRCKNCRRRRTRSWMNPPRSWMNPPRSWMNPCCVPLRRALSTPAKCLESPCEVF